MSEIKAPKHLSKASASWFDEVASAFELQGDQSRVLQIACESFDLAQQAREALKKEGLIVAGDRGGKRAHPCIMILNSASDRFLKACAMLGLSDDDVPSIPGQRKHRGKP